MSIPQFGITIWDTKYIFFSPTSLALQEERNPFYVLPLSSFFAPSETMICPWASLYIHIYIHTKVCKDQVIWYNGMRRLINSLHSHRICQSEWSYFILNWLHRDKSFASHIAQHSWWATHYLLSDSARSQSRSRLHLKIIVMVAWSCLGHNYFGQCPGCCTCFCTLLWGHESAATSLF